MQYSNNIERQLTLSLEVPPAKTSPLSDREMDWEEVALNWRCDLWKLLQRYVLPGSSGRMSPELCPQTEDETLRQFWAASAGGESPSLPLAGGVPGLVRESVMPTGSPGEFLTLNISESPSAAVGSSLSDILEETGSVPLDCCLSPRAIAGLLHRAEKRGSRVPSWLREFLIAYATQSSDQEPSGSPRQIA